MNLHNTTTEYHNLLSLFARSKLFLLSGLVLAGVFSATSLKAQFSPQNPLLFAVLAEFVNSNGLEFDDQRHLKQLKIDPHLIDTTYRWSVKLQKKHLAENTAEQIREHKNVLKRLGIPVTDAVADGDCFGSGGLPEPPDPDNPDKEKPSPYPPHCEEQGSFLTVIFEKPQLVADTSCTSKESRNFEENAQCWEVKAHKYTSHSYFIYGIYLLKEPQKGWKVIRKKRMGGIAS